MLVMEPAKDAINQSHENETEEKVSCDKKRLEFLNALNFVPALNDIDMTVIDNALADVAVCGSSCDGCDGGLSFLPFQ